MNLNDVLVLRRFFSRAGRAVLATALLALIWLGCIAAAQYQPRHDNAQQQTNSASQTATASGKARVSVSNKTTGPVSIEGQPPAYTFWSNAIDKAMIALLAISQIEHRLRTRRRRNSK